MPITKTSRLRIKRPRALDLFCGAGGASLGLFSAGFVVHGVDIELRRRDGSVKNPVILRGWEMDINTMSADDLRGYDFVWASHPCPAGREAGKENRAIQSAALKPSNKLTGPPRRWPPNLA